MENGNNSAKIQAIFFDLDNTVIATRKVDKYVCNRLSQILWERYAIPLDLASNASKSFLRAFRKCPEDPTMTLDAWRRLLWTQALGDQYNKYADEIYQTWLQLRYQYLDPTPDVRSLLQKLRHTYFIGLISNGTSHAQWEKIDRLNLQPLFDVILVSGDLPWEKPHQKIFQKACDFLGVRPYQCIMVGDKLETDILGGIEASLGGTVWIPLNYNERSLGNDDPTPDFVIQDLTELPKLLPKNPKALRFRTKSGSFRFVNKKRISLPDTEDSSSNASDGS